MATKAAKGTKAGFGLPFYAIAIIATALIATVLVIVSSSSSGLQACSGKVIGQAKYQCYTYYAHYYGSAGICSNLTGQYYNNCIYNVSYSLLKPGICTNISSLSYEASCVSAVSAAGRNASQCSILGEPYRSGCIYSIAKEGGFSALPLCSEIANSTLSLSCSASYYYGKALSTQDASYCGSLNSTPNATELSSLFLAGASKPSIFPSIYNVSPYGYCYSRVALEANTPSLCNALSGSDASVCKSGFSNQSQLNITAIESSCVQAGQAYPELVQACLTGIAIYQAIASRNVTRCFGLSQSYQNTCIFDIAREYNDTSYCSYISNSTVKSACNATVQR